MLIIRVKVGRDDSFNSGVGNVDNDDAMDDCVDSCGNDVDVGGDGGSSVFDNQ